MSNLFNDPGNKIKAWAKVLFVIEVIAAIVAAFLKGWEGFDIFKPALFFGILIGGLLTAIIGNLLMYGFGELIKNTEQRSVSSAERANTAPKPLSVNAVQKYDDEEFINCPKCGIPQNSRNVKCKACGAELHPVSEE